MIGRILMQGQSSLYRWLRAAVLVCLVCALATAPVAVAKKGHDNGKGNANGHSNAGGNGNGQGAGNGNAGGNGNGNGSSSQSNGRGHAYGQTPGATPRRARGNPDPPPGRAVGHHRSSGSGSSGSASSSGSSSAKARAAQSNGNGNGNNGNSGSRNNGNGNQGHPGKITICHSTGSATNPYVEITISENGLHGHARHHDGDDIIPAPAGGCSAVAVVESDARTSSGQPAAENFPVAQLVNAFNVIRGITASNQDGAGTSAVGGVSASNREAQARAQATRDLLGRQLPFTGLALRVLLLLGICCVVVGVAMRYAEGRVGTEPQHE
jgi:hypothetical protein